MDASLQMDLLTRIRISHTTSYPNYTKVFFLFSPNNENLCVLPYKLCRHQRAAHQLWKIQSKAIRSRSVRGVRDGNYFCCCGH
ncbi:hypothetical protein KFK09_006225 [Dendrobium nobile]|uniref:Uncharacterized protein n=1 Tax=Dendrobium nobile TaxID=94219 RepID=A0A8T3BR25_DENNO|nr:hypothetical protein KFK09_006225 [Dendrobium nobile]